MTAPGSTHAPSATPAGKVAGAFGLRGESWMRHANPASVWTRFPIIGVLALAVWSRDWIGIWCLVPVALLVVWLFVNPVAFRPPRSTRNWASRAVLGERIWVDRDKVDMPEQFRSQAPLVATAYSTVGLVLLVYGLIELDLVATVAGVLITVGGKAWFLDRVGLLFSDMKDRSSTYAAWDY